MQKIILMVCVLICGVGVQGIDAQELTFPQTEAEFVKALFEMIHAQAVRRQL